MEQGRNAFASYGLAFSGLVLGYWAAAVVGLQWSVVPGAGTALWPAAGIAFAGLALGGVRLWPAIIVGRLLAALTVASPQPVWGDLLIAIGTMLGALVPALILKRVGFDSRLGRMRDILWLALVGGGLGALISAAAGVALLWLTGTDEGRSQELWLSWWFGFLVGVLVVAPLVLTWWPSRGSTFSARRALHLLACVATLASVALAIFLLPPSPFLRVWHIFPLFLWAAIAFQVRGVALCLALLSAASITGLLRGSGPLMFDTLSGTQLLLVTQQFIAVVALTKLFLGAAIDEKRNIEAQARLAAIVSSSPDAMVSVDPAGTITSWNRGAERLFGYSAEEAIGQSVEIIIPTDLPEDHGPVLHRALSGESVALETLRLAKDGTVANVALTASQMRAPDGRVLGVAAVIRDITARKRIEDALRSSRDHQRLLINELNHRVKNSLAIVQAIAQQSFKGTNSTPAARAAFEGRLAALSAAHDLLTRENWDSASIRQVIADATEAYEGPGRFEVDGPDLRLPPKSAVALALALHELATNAVKYGALSAPGGRIMIRWTVGGDDAGDEMLSMTWKEIGGPPVRPPSQRGFGTRLIERSLAAEFGGSVRIDFAPEGVVCTIVAPLPASET